MKNIFKRLAECIEQLEEEGKEYLAFPFATFVILPAPASLFFYILAFLTLIQDESTPRKNR
jgi:hypothetical protein